MKSVKMIRFSIFFTMIFLGGSVGPALAASDTVDLRYESGGLELAPCSKSVAIITFEDNRKNTAIGESGKGKKFHSQNSVNEWVTRALYDELKSIGCTVEYHDMMGDFNTDATITGSVEEAYIKQNSWTKYNVNIRLRLDITTGNEKSSKAFRSSMTKTTVPSFSFNAGVAAESLQNVMREAVPALQKILE